MVGKISFAGVQTEFQPIPAGVYESNLVDYKFGKTGPSSKQPGSDKVDLQYAITEPGDFQNRRLFRTCTFTPESLWVFKRSMAALGADVDWENPEGVDPEEILRQVHNRPCLVKVSVEDYTDETGVTKKQNRVQDTLPTEETRSVQAEQAQQLNFAAAAPEPATTGGKSRG